MMSKQLSIYETHKKVNGVSPAALVTAMPKEPKDIKDSWISLWHRPLVIFFNLVFQILLTDLKFL